MKTRIFILLILAALTGSAALSGCGGGGKNTLSHLSAKELFALGKQKFDRHKYRDAIDAFQSLVYNYPGEPVIDTAQYSLALSYYSNEDWPLAQAEFNRLVTNYPSSPYAVQAQFMRAAAAFQSTPRSYGLDQTELQDVIKQLEDFVVDHPESELVPDANKLLAQANERLAKKTYRAGLVYTRINAHEAAKKYFQKVIDDYGSSPEAALAVFGLAQEEFKSGEYDKARQHFQYFATQYPNSKDAKDATRKAAESAFRSAEATYLKGDLPAASEKFAAFKRDFPNDSLVKKADEYLQRIGQQPSEKTPQANAQPK